MGQCKYCGEDAGFFSHVHKKCEEKHNQGTQSWGQAPGYGFEKQFNFCILCHCEVVEDFFCYDEKRIILWNNREVLLILQRDSGEESVIHIFDARWWASVVVSFSTKQRLKK